MSTVAEPGRSGTDGTTTDATAPAGTATFLFSDIEGSTRLEQELGTAGYVAVRERQREILRAAFGACGGVEQGTEGDSFFVVFPVARFAVDAAIRAQRDLAAEAWPDGIDVRVRMGLGAGEATMAGGSLVGIDINRAARIAGVAHGGQIVLSDAVRALVSGTLPADVSLRDLGEHRLKDLAPERLSQVVAEGLIAEFPPLRSLDARPNNLPTQLTTFVGRDRELAEALELLRRTRILTLTGPGGTGKTRLSLQAAAAAADRFAGGVFFVALEPVRDPTLVMSRIAATLGIAQVSGRPIVDLVVDWLGDREVLFVLDNFEQVIDGAGDVAMLLRRAPGLSVIVTSRIVLRITGEQEFPVGGLPAPPDVEHLSALERARLPEELRSIDPRTLDQFAAVRLFIERAIAVRPGFTVTNANAPAVAAICARLQGMPLAIELAAARVKILSPEAILARLDKQLSVLASASRDLPERQQTLRAAIAWSYDILDDASRRLLDRLSVFAGGFDLDRAEAVCGPSEELGLDVLDGLTSLVDQSLVRSEEHDGEPRFRLLDTIREYASEMLAARGEPEELERRHGAVFLALAEEAAPELHGTDQGRWLGLLEVEHDNIRAAIDRATERGDADTAIRIGFAMWRFWQKRGYLNEARVRLQRMAEQPWSRTDPRLRARLCEALGGVCWWQADPDQMQVYYDEALELWRGIGDKSEIANALYNASFRWVLAIDPLTVEPEDVDPLAIGGRYLEEALAIYRELGDLRGAGNALWGIGDRHYFRNESEQAVAPLEESLELFRRAGDRTMEAWAHHMLGSTFQRLSRFDESHAHLGQALEQFHAVGDTAGITLVLDDLYLLALAEDDLPRAARLRGAARNLSGATGVGLADVVDRMQKIYGNRDLHEMLSADEIERYAAEGAALALDEAVAYALGGELPGRAERSGEAAPARDRDGPGR